MSGLLDSLGESFKNLVETAPGDVERFATDKTGFQEGVEKLAHLFNPTSGGKLPGGGPFGLDKKGETKPKAKAKKKTAPKETGPTAAELEKEIAANPFAQMSQGLVKGLEAQEAPVEQAVSGALTAPATQSALQTAFAAAGLSPTSAAGQIVQSNVAQGLANDNPLQAAMSAYGNAFGEGQKTVDTALTNLGQANALGVATAPEQQWLTGLQSHIQEALSYYGTVPQSALATLPPALQYYLQQSGNEGATGTVPISSITFPKSDTALEPKSTTPKTALPTLAKVAGSAPGASTVASDTGSAPS